MRIKRNGILGILLLFAIAFPLLIQAASMEQEITIYHNDTVWYKTSRMPAYQLNYLIYVPISVFEMFDQMKVTQNRQKGYAMISIGSRYMSFDGDFAYTDDKKETYMKVYLFKEYYVPVNPVCAYFGFKVETSKNGKAIRISDSTTNKTLNDILLLYDPDSAETTAPLVTDTTPPVTTNSPITEKPPESSFETTLSPIEEIGERTIYLTFDDAPNAYTSQILGLLEQYSYSATFFLTGEKMLENPALVRQILIQGHTVGLQGMTAQEKKYKKNFQLLSDEIEEQNKLLSKITKKTTRFFRAPTGSAWMTEEQGKLLEKEGYQIWDWNVDITNNKKNATVGEMVETAKQGILQYKIPLIRLPNTANTVEALRQILEFIAQYDQFSVISLQPTAREMNFIGLQEKGMVDDG